MFPESGCDCGCGITLTSLPIMTPVPSPPFAPVLPLSIHGVAHLVPLPHLE